MSLDELRGRIDEIDIKLQELFEERMKLCDEVAVEKIRISAPVLQTNREELIIENVRNRAESGFEDSSESFIKSVMDISKNRQKKKVSCEILAEAAVKSVCAVIACGGNSSRMGGVNKLTAELCGEAVIIRTIKAFEKVEAIGKIILSVSKNSADEIEKLVNKAGLSKPVEIVYGGSTRQESVANGVVKANDFGYVCIHDGARPLITADVIERAINDAYSFGASVVCTPSKDTIKLSDGERVLKTPPREMLFSAQTPQVIRRDLYLKAYEKAKASGLDFTDDSQLCEFYGVNPKITVGEYTNIKITTSEDMVIAGEILNNMRVTK